MRPPRLRALLANALAIAAGLVVALALAEIGTRLFAPQPLSGSWLVYGPRGMLMNKAGGGPVRNELVGHDAVFYDFNAWHQRGRNEPDPGAARVLVLGDSFTFGFGLAVEDTFVARLQAMLDERGAGARSTVPRVQLLNASAGGWGTADQLTYLEAFGDRLAPSAVVVFVNFGDASRSIRSGLIPSRPIGRGSRRSTSLRGARARSCRSRATASTISCSSTRTSSSWCASPARPASPAAQRRRRSPGRSRRPSRSWRGGCSAAWPAGAGSATSSSRC